MAESVMHRNTKYSVWGEFWTTQWPYLTSLGLFEFINTGVEYVYPEEYAHMGAAFNWHQIGAGLNERQVTPAFIFDIGIETERGLLAVIEVEHTSPMSAGKRAFLSSHRVPFWEIPAAHTHEGQIRAAVQVFSDPFFSESALRARYGK
jgi:hypothetical protein